MRVLVVEDQVDLANDIADGLRDQGFSVDVAYDGSSAIAKGLENPYDVVVLDRDLPAVHGDDVCGAIVSSSSDARILMLTAASTVEDRVSGLNLGADDYLAKPFAFAELIARIHALSRRPPSSGPVLLHGDLEMNRAKRLVTRRGTQLSLTRKEFGILEELMLAAGDVVSAEELLSRVWDEHADPFSRTVTVTIGRLRQKLGDPDPIETAVGTGYRLR